jgi:hypothetical protein
MGGRDLGPVHWSPGANLYVGREPPPGERQNVSVHPSLVLKFSDAPVYHFLRDVASFGGKCFGFPLRRCGFVKMD